MLLIGYYQWAPIVMAIQAMLFYLPCLIWRLFMAKSGFNVRRILQMACDSNVLLPEHTMKNVRFIARYMENCIYRQRDYRKRKTPPFSGHPLNSYVGLSHNNQIYSQYTPYQTQSQSFQSMHHQHHHPHVQFPPYLQTSQVGGHCSPHNHHFHHHHHVYHPTNPSQTPSILEETRYVNYSSESAQTRRGSANSLLDKLKHSFSIEESNRKHKKRLASVTEENAILKSSNNDFHPMLGRLKLDESSVYSTQTSKPLGNFRTGQSSTTGPSALVSFRTNAKNSKQKTFRISKCCSKEHGNFLVCLYFFTKFLYLINIIGQLFLMEKFVGNEYTFYGFRVLIDLINGREWCHSGNFPRVTFCDFEAKKLGKNHK